MSGNKVTDNSASNEMKNGVKRSSNKDTVKNSSSLVGSAKSSTRSKRSSTSSSKSRKERSDRSKGSSTLSSKRKKERNGGDRHIKITIMKDSFPQEKNSHVKYVMSTRDKSANAFPVMKIKQTGSMSEDHTSSGSSGITSKELSISKVQNAKYSGSRKRILKIASFAGLSITLVSILIFVLLSMQRNRINAKESLYGLVGTEFFGSSLSLTSDGEMLAVGGHKIARVYSNIGDERNKEWIPVVDLSSFTSGDYFSSYAKVVLSSNGSHLIVGDPDSNENGENSGSISIFENFDVNWRNIGVIHGSTPYSKFGISVDISDDGTRIISASGVGHVYFYELENRQWQEKKVFENIGSVASISGDGKRMAVGNGKANSGAGKLAIYDLDTLSLIASKDSNEDLIRLGNSIAFSKDGSTIAVGMAYDLTIDLSLGRSQSSFVSVYRLDPRSRDLIEYGEKIVGPNYSHFGRSIALSDDGNIIAIGAPRFDARKENVGRTLVYRMKNGGWTRFKRITGLSNSEELGSSVALSGDGKMLGMGSPKNDAFGSYTGRVRALMV